MQFTELITEYRPEFKKIVREKMNFRLLRNCLHSTYHAGVLNYRYIKHRQLSRMYYRESKAFSVFSCCA